MSGGRWVNGANLLSALRKTVPKEATRDVTLLAVREYVQAQPEHPDLVGPTRAAEILGVKPPHISRMRSRGKMPKGFPVEGSREAYERSDLLALADELEQERARRERAATAEGTAA